MGNFNKWNRQNNGSGELRVVLFVTRNKDNADVKGFKERRRAFLTTKTVDELAPEFQAFVEAGLAGEMSRLYLSVNPRDNEKTQKDLMHYLLDNDVDMVNLPSKVAALAAKSTNRTQSNWLVDYDDDVKRVDEFVKEMTAVAMKFSDKEFTVEKHKTPNGFGLVVNRGFKFDELNKDWDFGVKKDDLLCVKWDTKK